MARPWPRPRAPGPRGVAIAPRAHPSVRIPNASVAGSRPPTVLATRDDSLPPRGPSIDYRSMMSLRAKVTAALLVTSLAAIALFGLTARGLILSRFDDLVIDQAFRFGELAPRGGLGAVSSEESGPRPSLLLSV